MYEENWYTLAVAIIKDVLPERAFNFMNGKQTKHLCSEVDTRDMIIMREQKMTYREIGQIYGMTDGAVYRRIKNLKEKGEKTE